MQNATEGKLGWSKLRSACLSLIAAYSNHKWGQEDWGMVKRKMYWDRSKRFSASERLLWALSLILDLLYRQLKHQFSWRVIWHKVTTNWHKVTYVNWKTVTANLTRNLIQSWYWLILVVDTELTLPAVQLKPGGFTGIGTLANQLYNMYLWYNCQRQSHLTLFLQKNVTADTATLPLALLRALLHLKFQDSDWPGK